MSSVMDCSLPPFHSFEMNAVGWMGWASSSSCVFGAQKLNLSRGGLLRNYATNAPKKIGKSCTQICYEVILH